MTDEADKARSEAEDEVQREIRKEQKFDLAAAIGRLAGPGALKGVSPIARMQQAEMEIETWLRRHIPAAEGALEIVLLCHVKRSELLLNNYDQPLIVLGACCQQVLSSDYQLRELVRDADVEWGRMFGERPYFDQEGSPPNPNDPYTIETVRTALSGLIAQLEAGA